jgi:hypothetical protein
LFRVNITAREFVLKYTKIGPDREGKLVLIGLWAYRFMGL